MKFLLVVPRYTLRFGQYYEFPLGLAYVSSSLKHAGFDVACVNLNHEREAFSSVLARVKPDVVATGGLSTCFHALSEIVSAARQFGCLTVLGGGIVSCSSELAFNLFRPEVGVLFEGEETMVELAYALENGESDLSKVKGIMFRKDGRPFKTDKRMPIKNLDTIAFPDFKGFDADQYLDGQMTSDSHFFYHFDRPRALPMITSCSCPFSCTFCAHPIGESYRQRGLDNIFSEIDWLVERFKVNMVLFYDELFAVDRGRIESFCCRIKSYGLKWICQMRVSHVDGDLLRIMKDAGCCTVGYGLESMSDTVLASMGKHVLASQVETGLALTRENGLGIQGNFIFGDSEETLETANETLDWWSHHQEYQIRLTPIYVYAGTELYKRAVEKGLIRDEAAHLMTKYPVVNVSKLDDVDFRNLLSRLKLLNMQNRQRFSGKVVFSWHNSDIYRLTVECPHCHARNVFDRFKVDLTMVNEAEGVESACRHCNQRFTVFAPTKTLKLLKLFPLSMQDWIGEYLLKYRKIRANPQLLKNKVLGAR